MIDNIEKLNIKLSVINKALNGLYVWTGDPEFLSILSEPNKDERLYNIRYLQTIKDQLELQYRTLGHHIDDLLEEHQEMLIEEGVEVSDG